MDILQTIISQRLGSIDIESAIDFAVKQHHEELEDLNTMQLDKGVDMEGKSLGSYGKLIYKGRYQPVDLKKTGDWRKSQKVTSQKGVIEMTASNLDEAQKEISDMIDTLSNEVYDYGKKLDAMAKGAFRDNLT